MSLIATLTLAEEATISKIRIKYELKNTTNKTLYVCQYYTPLESISNSGVFTVYNNTKQCDEPYCGMKASRIPPTAECYKKIEPNETIFNTVEMIEAFKFNVNQEYTVKATNSLNVVDNLKKLNNFKSSLGVSCISNPLTFTVI